MVGTAQPLCLSASETEGRRYDMTMNPGKSEITAPHYNAGLDDEMPSSRRGSVFLDIPFYRTGLSDTGFSGANFRETGLLRTWRYFVCKIGLKSQDTSTGRMVSCRSSRHSKASLGMEVVVS